MRLCSHQKKSTGSSKKIPSTSSNTELVGRLTNGRWTDILQSELNALLMSQDAIKDLARDERVVYRDIALGVWLYFIL